ncbi:MAG: aminotransferase class IV [Planctomycetes bacterium]|nr:aminotransferase class IV [Planctomycetota bacterium]
MQVMLNGKRVDPSEAQVSIFDRGFLFGDAIYEVVRTYGRKLTLLPEHMERLTRSGDAIGLDVPALRPLLEAEIQALIESAPPGELYVRIMLTRGRCSDMGLGTVEGEPTRIVWVKPLEEFPEAHYRRGIRLQGVRPDAIVARIAPGVKSNNRQSNVMAYTHARAAGFDDALFVDPSGLVTEGPTWNAFFVIAGELVTPPLERGILEGITRRKVLSLCKELGIPYAVRELSLEQATQAAEAFITSTTRGVMPVGQLDETRFAPIPGPITARLHDALASRMEASSS